MTARNLFDPPDPTDEQRETLRSLRANFSGFLQLLLAQVPPGVDRDHAVRSLRDCARWCEDGVTRNDDGSPREDPRSVQDPVSPARTYDPYTAAVIRGIVARCAPNLPILHLRKDPRGESEVALVGVLRPGETKLAWLPLVKERLAEAGVTSATLDVRITDTNDQRYVLAWEA